VEEKRSELSKAERDSIIAIYRSFAYERWKNGDWETARKHFNTVRFHDLEHKHNIYRTWADCFVREGLMDSALYAYQEGVNYFPDDDYLRNSLAIMYRNSGRLDEAIEQQKAVVRLKPEQTEYLRGLAELYESAENWDAAIDAYQQLTKLQPDNPDLHQRLTDIIRIHRNPEEYLQAMREAVDKFPDDPVRRFEYASALLEQGHNKEAVKEFRQYIKLRPMDPEGPRGLAHALQNLGNFELALGALEDVIKLKPESLPDIIEVGKVHLELGNWSKARSLALRAIGIDQNYGPAWVLMGDIYYKAADMASGDSPKYNDKLVFLVAYGLYGKATSSSDPQTRSDGDRRRQIIRSGELIPSKEERFMHMRQVRPTGETYKWIDNDWPEVKYIDEFLKELD